MCHYACLWLTRFLSVSIHVSAYCIHPSHLCPPLSLSQYVALSACVYVSLPLGLCLPSAIPYPVYSAPLCLTVCLPLCLSLFPSLPPLRFPLCLPPGFPSMSPSVSPSNRETEGDIEGDTEGDVERGIMRLSLLLHLPTSRSVSPPIKYLVGGQAVRPFVLLPLPPFFSLSASLRPPPSIN